MQALKIIGALVGTLVLGVTLFMLAAVFIFWREPDARETCANVARFSSNVKAAASDLGMKACVQSMSSKTYGFGAKKRLASYRRCLHDAASPEAIKQCEATARN